MGRGGLWSIYGTDPADLGKNLHHGLPYLPAFDRSVPVIDGMRYVPSRKTAPMKTYHILPTPDGSWKAVLAGTDEMLAGFENKEKLIDHMAKWAADAKESISVRIHTQDGRFEEERTYPRSADPVEREG